MQVFSRLQVLCVAALIAFTLTACDSNPVGPIDHSERVQPVEEYAPVPTGTILNIDVVDRTPQVAAKDTLNG